MDWIEFLQDNNIEFTTSGKNTRRGEVSVKCPWCADDDPGMHMGIALTHDAYGCWRSVDHRGKKPRRLIQALLGCSFSQSDLIVKQYSRASPDGLDDIVARLSGAELPVKQINTSLEFLPEFRTIEPVGSTSRHWRYLENRGFEAPRILCKEYGLLACNTGKFADRVIIPVNNMVGKLVGWTSRALGNPVQAPRYLSLSENDGALSNINHMVYNEDKLYNGGDLLLIAEGPFDALKLDHYGRQFGCRATCTFGTSMSMQQAAAIVGLAARFRQAYLVFDKDALAATFSAGDVLAVGGVKIWQLPDWVKDPGEMSRRQVERFVMEMKDEHTRVA